MLLRAGQSADAAAIAQLHAESWRRSYQGIMPSDFLDGPVVQDRHQAWTERLSDPPEDAVLRVAEIDGRIAGFFYACPDREPEWQLLDNLHVNSVIQSKGIGTALMRDGARCLAEMGWRKVRLLVLAQNIAACRFYQRLGGVRGPIEPYGFRGLGPFDAVPYRWSDFKSLVTGHR